MLIWHDEEVKTIIFTCQEQRMSNVTQIVQVLQAIFEPADAVARSTGFVQRERKDKITGKRFALTVVFGLLQRGEQAMSDLSHFARHSGMSISAPGLQERFTQAAAVFLQTLLNLAFTQVVVVADSVAMPLLRRFRDVIVEDSSSFPLPDGCGEEWQGWGGSSTNGTQAAFKVQVRWDLLCGGFKGLAWQHGRTPDNCSPLKGTRRGLKSVRNSDLGYVDTAEFADEEAAGEYFFSRAKGGVKLYDEQGNELDVLNELQEKAGGQEYECRVLVSAARRVPARLIAVPVPEEVAIKRQAGQRRRAQKHSRKPSAALQRACHWTLLLTTIPREELSIAEALVLVRFRWHVELLFKLWKQTGQADVSRSEQPWHVLCDRYAKLLGLLITHWLMIVGCWHLPSRSMVKATNAIRADIVLLARAVAGKGELLDVVREMIEGVEQCRMNPPRTAPNTYQLMAPPPPPVPCPVQNGSGASG